MQSKPFRVPVVQLILVLLGAGALCACSGVATRSTKAGSTSFQMFMPPSAPRIHTQRNQKVVLGMPIEQPAPVYPPQMIQQNIPRRSVCLTIAINRKGVVYEARPLYTMPGCPANAAAAGQAFVDAARDAVIQWRYTPTILCTFPKNVDASTMSAYCVGAKRKALPISLAFLFVFTQHNGVTAVHATRTTH